MTTDVDESIGSTLIPSGKSRSGTEPSQLGTPPYPSHWRLPLLFTNRLYARYRANLKAHFAAMPPTKLGSAVPQLQELAKWVYESAKMQQDKSICVDDNQFEKTLPLLKALGYDKIQGYGFAIHRISGNTEIIKGDGIRTLFFPLSVGSGRESIASGNVEVAGVMLTPGTFMEIDSTTDLDARLDCLIVYLPERR